MSKIIWFVYRLSCLKYIGLFSKFFVGMNRLIFGCYISPQAVLHKDVIFHYQGMGVVIGSNVVLGANCEIGQHVTLGARHVDGIEIKKLTIGANTYIGAGAVCLGPLEIGENSIIGAGSVVINSFESNSIIAGNPARLIRNIKTRKFGDVYE